MFKHRVRSYRGNFHLHKHMFLNDIFYIYTHGGQASPEFIVEIRIMHLFEPLG